MARRLQVFLQDTLENNPENEWRIRGKLKGSMATYFLVFCAEIKY